MRNFHAFKTGVSAILARLWNNFVKCIFDVNDLFISAQRTTDANSYISSVSTCKGLSKRQEQSFPLFPNLMLETGFRIQSEIDRIRTNLNWIRISDFF